MFCKKWRPATLFKKRLWHRCFSKNTFFTENVGATASLIGYVDKKLEDKSNHQTLIASIKYIKNAQQFEQAIFWISESNFFYQMTMNVLVYFLLLMKKP